MDQKKDSTAFWKWMTSDSFFWCNSISHNKILSVLRPESSNSVMPNKTTNLLVLPCGGLKEGKQWKNTSKCMLHENFYN